MKILLFFIFFFISFFVIQAHAFTPLFLASVASSGRSNRPVFFAPLQTTLVPTVANGSNTPTFTRASTATLTDFSGNIKYPISGEARFRGARRVQNLIAQSEADTNWVAGGTTAPTVSTSVVYSGLTATATIFPAISGGSYFVSRATGSNGIELLSHAYRWRAAIAFSRVLTGSESITVYVTGANGLAGVIFTSANSSTSWGNYSTLSSPTVFAGVMYFAVYATKTTSPVTVYLSQRQVEDVSGQTNLNPSEYISNGILTAPYYGAGVNGVKYFNYLNGNTVNGSNIIAAGTGALITNANSSYADKKGPFGYFSEPASTNLCLYSRDMTQTNWVATNATTALTQTGIDGSTLSASLLTATAANATILQTITQAATSSTYSVYVKRVSGSGSIKIVQGATTADITALINSSTWTRVYLNASELNPSIGFNIVTNGDAIAIDGNQFEAISYPTSYIPTLALTATRAVDVLYYSSTNNYFDAAGSASDEIVGMYPGLTTTPYSLLFLNRGASGRILYLGGPGQLLTLCSIYDGTNIAASSSSTSFNNAVAPIKMATSWSGSSMSTSYNGTTPNTTNYIGNFGSGNIYIGGQAGSNTLTGTQRNIEIWNKALPSGSLRAITNP
jgi:hypothetical protein